MFKLHPYQEAVVEALKNGLPEKMVLLPYSGMGSRAFIHMIEPQVDDQITLANIDKALAKLRRNDPIPALVFSDEVIRPTKSLQLRPIRPDYYRESIEFKPMQCPLKIKMIVMWLRGIYGDHNV